MNCIALVDMILDICWNYWPTTTFQLMKLPSSNC